jgi:SAM-dependent methyltransferase
MGRQLPDFDAVYGRAVDPGAVQVPWIIGEPQPAIASLVENGQVRGAVLDAGCGVGDTTFYLAERGYPVLGLDISPTAIGQARDRARQHWPDVEFAVADVTSFTGFDGRFDTVIDSTVLHSLPVESRSDYLAAIARAAAPGASLHVLAFAHGAWGDSTGEEAGPNTVDEAELRDAVSRHWSVDSVAESTIVAVRPPRGASHLSTDEQGRVLLPAYLLSAHRD